MAFTNAAKNAALDEIGSLILYVSAHNGDPSTTGANEITGGSPAYARKAVTWAAASAGSKALNGTLPTFDVPAGASVTHVGWWSAATAGTFYGSWDVTNETFVGQGTYGLTAGTISLT